MRKLFIIISIVSVAGLLPFIILSFFNQPVDDDYWYTWMAKEYGVWGAVRQWAVTINGRYSSNAFMSFNSLVHGHVISFKLLPILTSVLWVVVSKSYVDSILKNILPSWQRLALAFFYVMIYYWNMPGINDGLFWASSVACYQLPLIMFAWLFLLLVKNNEGPLSLLKGCTFFAGSLIAGGFHEMLAFMASVLGVIYVLFQSNTIRRLSVSGIAFTAGAIISLAIQILSVGNHLKADLVKHDGVTNDVVSLIKIVVFQTSYQIAARVVLSPSYWLLALLVFYLCCSCRAAIKLVFPGFTQRFIVLYWILLLVASFFPAVLMASVAGSAMPPRISNVTYFVFLTGSLAGIFFTILSFPQSAFSNALYHVLIRRKILIISFLCITTVPFSRSLKYAVADIFLGSASRYNDEINARLSNLKDCKDSICSIEKLINRPQTLYRQGMDASENKTYLSHLEKVYGKKIIVADR